MIKEVRKLTGLSHEKLGAWLGVSKSMVQFAEFSFRTLQGDASNKLTMLALAVQQLKDTAKPGQPEFVAYNKPAAFASQHKEKYDNHSYQAGKLQQQLKQLMQQHEKFITGLALLDAMKNLDTELYSSTEKDKHITGLLEYFGQDKIEPVCKKMELLQDRIDIHLGYAEVHKQQWEKFEQMKK